MEALIMLLQLDRTSPFRVTPKELPTPWGRVFVWSSGLRLNVALKVSAAALAKNIKTLSYQDSITYCLPSLLAHAMHLVVEQRILETPGPSESLRFRISVLPPGQLAGLDMPAFFETFGYRATFEQTPHRDTAFRPLRVEANKPLAVAFQELAALLAAIDPHSAAVLPDHLRNKFIATLKDFPSSYGAIAARRLGAPARVPQRAEQRPTEPNPFVIYLPPGGLASVQMPGPELEHPDGAFNYYRQQGVSQCIVELKHMGSRAVVVLCKDETSAQKGFGSKRLGSIYTKNGRPFFYDEALERRILSELSAALTARQFWEKFETDWVCLDGEITPWALKGEKFHEATVSRLQSGALQCAEEVLAAMADAPAEWRRWAQWRRDVTARTIETHTHFAVPEDATPAFAPFHLLATAGRLWTDRDHLWHMTTLRTLAEPAFASTEYLVVDLAKEQSRARAIAWWHELGRKRFEGFVVKPLPFVATGKRSGLAQPAIKCRTPEYLRLVYGPEYDDAENLAELLTGPAAEHRRNKHRRITHQFLLGLESLRAFVHCEGQEVVRGGLRALSSLDTAKRDGSARKQALAVLSNMTNRDEEIIEHIVLYRISIRPVLRRLSFFPTDASMENVLQRLMKEKRIQSVGSKDGKAPIDGGFSYYAPTPQECKRRNIPKERQDRTTGPLHQALAVLWFCCMTPVRRARMEREDFAELFPDISSNDPHCIEERDEVATLYRVYVPGSTSGTKYVLKQQLQEDVQKLAEHPEARKLLLSKEFAFAILVEDPGRQRKLIADLAKIQPTLPCQPHIIVELAPGPTTLKTALKEMTPRE